MRTALSIVLALQFYALSATAQPCVFKDSVICIHFGTSSNPEERNMSFLNQYRQVDDPCPDDGSYAYLSETSGCFNDDWHRVTEDHTPGDQEGKFLLVNATRSPGVFFISYAGTVEPNALYEFRTWVMNICRTNTGCRPTNPNINFSIETEDGKKLASFNTGEISRKPTPHWELFNGFFSSGNKPARLVLVMRSNGPGGCGNDFAIDDILIRRCYPPDPPPTPITEAKVKQPARQDQKPATQPEPTLSKKKMVAETRQIQAKTAYMKTPEAIGLPTINTPVPKPLLERSNPVAGNFKGPSGPVKIEVYDNGQIDGDTVSIYINNKLIAGKAGLSAKPIELQVTLSPDQPHHEIVMVAENLGNIPPNTSVMIITSRGKRKEVFISSSEQANAKVLIDLE